MAEPQDVTFRPLGLWTGPTPGVAFGHGPG